jgi:WD40 repeat protein
VISGSWDKTLKAWNLETRKELFTLTGHAKRVNAVAVTSDGKRIISGSKDKTIKVWNLEARKELFTLTGHTDKSKWGGSDIWRQTGDF